jgi:hypothetical protein
MPADVSRNKGTALFEIPQRHVGVVVCCRLHSLQEVIYQRGGYLQDHRVFGPGVRICEAENASCLANQYLVLKVVYYETIRKGSICLLVEIGRRDIRPRSTVGVANSMERTRNTYYLMISHLQTVQLRPILVGNGRNPVRLRPRFRESGRPQYYWPHCTQ